MGWSFMRKPTDVKQYLSDLMTWENEHGACRPVEVKIVRLNTLYAAVERLDKRTGEREVGAVVILLKYTRDYFNFGYKDMGEEMGPYEAHCPASILDKLTPTDSEYANEWRAKCRENLVARKPWRIVVGAATVAEYTKRVAAYKRAVKEAASRGPVILAHQSGQSWLVQASGSWAKLV